MLLCCRDLKPENILLDDDGELIDLERSAASCINTGFANCQMFSDYHRQQMTQTPCIYTCTV